MTRYIGLDAHSASCTFAVMGPSGKRIREERLETCGKLIKSFVSTIPRPRHLCMEEGALSEFLYELLEPQVDELVVVQPEKREGSKSDSIDAWARADELRRGTLSRPVFKAPGRFRALREAMRAYLAIQQDMVRTKLRLKAIYRSRGINGTGEEIYHPNGRRGWLEELPRPNRCRAELLSDELDRLVDVYEEAEALFREEANRTPEVALIATAPGIGTIRAAEIVATMVSPHRFRTKRQFWSYCGLGVITRSSADWVKGCHGQWVFRHDIAQTRGLNRNRNPLLKNVFKGAATHVVTRMPEHPLSQDYRRMLKDTKPNLARLTIARRLAAAVLAMWKKEEEYDPAKHQGKKSAH